MTQDQQFIVFAHWVDQDGGRNSFGRHVTAPHIAAACEILEQHVRAAEPAGILELWTEAIGDV